MNSKCWLTLLGLLGILLLGSLLFLSISNPMVGNAKPLPQDEVDPHDTSFPPSNTGLSIPMPGVDCTVEYTTTDKSPTNNHTLANAAALAEYTGQSLLDDSDTVTPTQVVKTRSDFYRLDNANLNYRYTISALPDRTRNYNLGIIVYDFNATPIITDMNAFDGNVASVSLVAQNRGPYFFEVFQWSDQCSGGTYSLSLSAVAPTSTPDPTATSSPAPETPTPAPTWVSGYDQYEPNFSFETAQTIAPGVTYELNFTPWGGATEPDNDYFKLWVKPGLQFACETFDLGPVVDTNMILYDENRNLIGGNDDRALGDYSSRVSFYSTYEGYLYLLVGTGERLSFEDAKNSPYKLRCTKTVPGTPTEDGDDDGPSKAPTPIPTATSPTSPVPTPTLGNTPTPEGNGGTVPLNIRALTTPPPLSPTPTPSGFRTFRVIIYYDSNNDGQFGAGEGVSGFYVRVMGASGVEELAHGYTDEQGQGSFSVPTVRTVRVIVPLLGLDRLVEPSTPEVKVRIAPHPLPDTIP